MKIETTKVEDKVYVKLEDIKFGNCTIKKGYRANPHDTPVHKVGVRLSKDEHDAIIDNLDLGLPQDRIRGLYEWLPDDSNDIQTPSYGISTYINELDPAVVIEGDGEDPRSGDVGLAIYELAQWERDGDYYVKFVPIMVKVTKKRPRQQRPLDKIKSNFGMSQDTTQSTTPKSPFDRVKSKTTEVQSSNNVSCEDDVNGVNDVNDVVDDYFADVR